MPGYTLNQWIDKYSAEEICRSEGYTIIKAREVLKDLGYDIKELKSKYQFSDKVLSELFAYRSETKLDLYRIIHQVTERAITLAEELLSEDPSRRLPSFHAQSPRSVYLWRCHNGINNFRCYDTSSRILCKMLKNKCGKLIVYKDNES